MDRVQKARRLRRGATEAETALWQHLRSRRLCGCKFVRQFAIGPYIVDFACRAAKLVVELDGGQHAVQKNQDDARTRYLEREGWTVLRFWNSEALAETDAVLGRIGDALDLALNRS